MQKVLIIRFSSFGDIVLLFPAIEFLISQNKKIYVLTKKKYQPLFELLGNKVQIYTISDHANIFELIEKIKLIRAHGFDYVYDLHRNLRSRIVTFLLQTPFVRIEKYRFKEFFLFLFKRKIADIFWRKTFLRKEEALKLVGCENTADFLKNYLLKESHDQVISPQLAALSEKFVCINPDSAWKTKMWDLNRFFKIEEKLLENGFQVIWLGLDKSLPISEKKGTLNWISKLTVQELAFVLQKANALVCNDAGLMHLSEALGTPVVGIFGPTTKELGFAPSLFKSKVVENDLWCRPCSKSGKWCHRLIEKQKCLKLVSHEDVWNKLKRVVDPKNEDMDL